MYLTEIYSTNDDYEKYRSPKEDQSSLEKIDTRKTRLTLAHINKLRIMNDARTVEHEQKIKEIQKQYKVPAQTV